MYLEGGKVGCREMTIEPPGALQAFMEDPLCAASQHQPADFIAGLSRLGIVFIS